MKRRIFYIFSLLLLANGVSAQAVDKTVEKIEKYYADISEKARLCEIDDERGEFGDLVMNELVINKRNRQWRAVGKYYLTYKFFYRGGNTEKRMYPDQLVKVVVDKKISDREYVEEFLYSDKGEMMFYFQKAVNDDSVPAERRVYFSAGQPIRIVEDGKARDRINKNYAATVRKIVANSAKIKQLFSSSIKL